MKIHNYLKMLMVFALFMIAATPASAVPIMSMPGLEGLGSYTGDFEFTAVDDNSATISLSLTNTSPLANGGYLTAFAFINPDNSITSATITSSLSSFGLIGGPTFTNSIQASPYDNFDIGASNSPNAQQPWLGSGNPSTGIAVNQTGTFTFALQGSGFSGLSNESFFTTLNDPDDPTFAARFRGFNDGGSDKVPGTPAPVPEPATMLLLGTGLVGLAGFGRKRIKK